MLHNYVVIKEMEERLLSLLRRETVVLQQGLPCPVIEADKMALSSALNYFMAICYVYMKVT